MEISAIAPTDPMNSLTTATEGSAAQSVSAPKFSVRRQMLSQNFADAYEGPSKYVQAAKKGQQAENSMRNQQLEILTSVTSMIELAGAKAAAQGRRFSNAEIVRISREAEGMLQNQKEHEVNKRAEAEFKRQREQAQKEAEEAAQKEAVKGTAAEVPDATDVPDISDATDTPGLTTEPDLTGPAPDIVAIAPAPVAEVIQSEAAELVQSPVPPSTAPGAEKNSAPRAVTLNLVV